MKTLIVYFTETGHTLEAAEATAKGIKEAGSEVDIVKLEEFNPAILDNYDSLIVGAPCWNGGMTKNGVPRHVAHMLKSLPEDCLDKMRCGGISVHAVKGGETTVETLGRLLDDKGCIDFRTGPAAKAGTPLSLAKGHSITTEDRERFISYGSKFVE